MTIYQQPSKIELLHTGGPGAALRNSASVLLKEETGFFHRKQRWFPPSRRDYVTDFINNYLIVTNEKQICPLESDTVRTVSQTL